ncbi:autotransporter domain-containing protein [Niveispirillum sp. SYP-B3756]|uniref:autotransporter outer membrane beta-barrel domain-containing protein n=1 Tax=Niveispirillum sp. SYP-B3756 TaxID=2662178 RepID=UPI0012924284|nr:autotransporter outer membrane beta-barrel domain-containing protein [Niveispirillum sp. SYP-B3756]MQP64856.1 autotransporter domain-containing protein [Niveispirillum sp. SYP-B3756]
MNFFSRLWVFPLGSLLVGVAPASAQLIPNLPQIPRTTVTDQVVTEENLQTNTQVFTGAVSDRVSDALRSFDSGDFGAQQTAFAWGQSGIELTAPAVGGTSGARLDGWGRMSTSWLDDNFTDTAMSGRIHTPVLGLDRVQGATVLGMALGYERIDLSTKFNNGKLTADGVSILPYIGTRLTNDLILDGGINYSSLRYHRQDNRNNSRASQRSFNADRLLLFSNLTAYAPASWTGGVVGLSARTGLSWAVESQAGSKDSSGRAIGGGVNRLGRWTAGLRADGKATPGSDGTPGFVPLASLTYQLDFVQNNDTELNETRRPKDRSSLLGGVGFSVGLTPRAQLTAEYNRVFARKKLDSQTLLIATRISL